MMLDDSCTKHVRRSVRDDAHGRRLRRTFSTQRVQLYHHKQGYVLNNLFHICSPVGRKFMYVPRALLTDVMNSRSSCNT